MGAAGTIAKSLNALIGYVLQLNFYSLLSIR